VPTALHLTVPDDRDAIVRALELSVEAADIVIATGGLGPTDDDLTRFALADLLEEREMVMDGSSWAHVQAYFEARGRQAPQRSRVQALRPSGARMIDNPQGTARGLHARHRETDVYCLPGVPSEMRAMFKGQIRPALVQGSDRPTNVILTARINTFGEGESAVAQRLGDLTRRDRNPLVGLTLSAGTVCVRIRSQFPTDGEAAEHLQATVAQVEQRLSPIAFGRDEQTLAQCVFAQLTDAGRTVATAESCTAGLLGKMLTDPPGSSAAYVGGWVVYTNDLKRQQLGVPAETLETHGAVSEAVAAAMADAARARSGADFALAITGIAGPGGGTPDKPVGTVWIALAERDRPPLARCFHFPDDRDGVRQRSAMTALDLLRRRLLETRA
ncbi:MAG: CinA family nicotinamide mononucleotide deamidase-related protein, partial [Phycisphaerae bacterium]|nr:CinA family nicotinamide mononucleotide deamidase-related protein [Phycisphaerae bacterium]